MRSSLAPQFLKSTAANEQIEICVLTRITGLHRASSLTSNPFTLRRNLLTDARISSVDLTHLQGCGISLCRVDE